MLFVIVGVLLIVLHFAGIGPMANWGWRLSEDLWKFCAPFVLAMIWWSWAEWSGYYKRREMERMEEKRKLRREENMEALGIDLRQRRARRPGRGT
jgi:small Trp-rich protein